MQTQLSSRTSAIVRNLEKETSLPQIDRIISKERYGTVVVLPFSHRLLGATAQVSEKTQEYERRIAWLIDGKTAHAPILLVESPQQLQEAKKLVANYGFQFDEDSSVVFTQDGSILSPLGASFDSSKSRIILPDYEKNTRNYDTLYDNVMERLTMLRGIFLAGESLEVGIKNAVADLQKIILHLGLKDFPIVQHKLFVRSQKE